MIPVNPTNIIGFESEGKFNYLLNIAEFWGIHGGGEVAEWLKALPC